MKKRTIITLLVRIYALVGVLRIGVVALDSLVDMTDTLHGSKGVRWIYQGREEVGKPVDFTEAHPSKSFLRKALNYQISPICSFTDQMVPVSGRQAIR